ncbi:aldehyde dehydrogenase family protein [Paeniglutamicibacter psychrophenolicus]|uniref:aldehyde dehydrogenase family protein n=1 Tax=Paeniglutamicibacter psychrophenolicus TaxID=257454 RepID=UPI00278A1D10|nr:aldehyde dehydrogenase family protein [Paeniglutamicibacter psychrophenolicus]MDQ0092320.1 aldehyde dehydrogenase (NAD+) [Paeniglutamicibacter psychrophenolicus]
MTETITQTDVVPLRLLIDGSWVEGTGHELESTSPTDPRQVVAAGGTATVDDVRSAMSAARAAAAGWAATPMAERGGYLSRAAGIVTANAEAWGTELAREEGKTVAEGRGEVLRAAQILSYYSAESDRLAGEVFSSPRRGEKILVTRKPLGVVGVITPFNFPIAIPAWKIAPALVFGNTVVWKPASTVPLLAMRLAQALVEAGLPAGVLNLVLGSGALGNEIVNHPELDGLTFTGSTGVGRKLAAAAAGAGVPIQAEMGGKNASVVLEDADLELATEQVLFGAFRSTGQKCTATSRLILQESIAVPFLERLRERLGQWKTGDPTDPSVHMGPVVSPAAAGQIRAGIAASMAQGATVGFEGDVASLGDAFVAPTVLEVPDAGNDAWREEFFGPVLAVRRVATTEEAFALANDSEYGLSCALFTQDLSKALAAMESIDVGILHVNSESAGADPHVPFGGAKKSGYGPKEQGGAAKEFFTHTTTVYLRGA